ncbi:lecithin retinol acyltransferase family protein [Vibrio azureus]|uniref:LRAT domain-containing protein n=1 Tax=Vibrio azureus NBRC 104587 TaxID=1219077 RepID=U3AR88_9VIBR|nr:lecithin retinol acyltransferase family protein [Vibrio azureus]GAD75777.1 hypothetical protein VAZ01S_029_00470 [Vibrio azureus NBRC 104587]
MLIICATLNAGGNGNIEICALEKYANGKPIKVVSQRLSEKEKNELLSKAEQLSKKANKYGVLANNCEHLVSKVLHGESSSEQLQGAVVGLLFAHCSQSKNSLLPILAGGFIGCKTVNSTRKYDCVV